MYPIITWVFEVLVLVIVVLEVLGRHIFIRYLDPEGYSPKFSAFEAEAGGGHAPCEHPTPNPLDKP